MRHLNPAYALPFFLLPIYFNIIPIQAKLFKVASFLQVFPPKLAIAIMPFSISFNSPPPKKRSYNDIAIPPFTVTLPEEFL